MNWLALDAIARNGDGLDGRLRQLLDLRASRAMNPGIIDLKDRRSQIEAGLAIHHRPHREAPAEPGEASRDEMDRDTVDLHLRRPA